MKTLPLLVRIDSGTNYTNRFIINPLFVLLTNMAMENIKRINEIFGIRYSH